MGGSLRVGRFVGIDVFLHWTFLLLIAGAFVYYVLSGNDLATALAGVGLILAVFACVVLHEYGHALAARRYGVPTRDITLYPIGGVARLERIPEKPRQELVVALAGPAVNFVVAGLIAGGYLVTRGSLPDFNEFGGLAAPADYFLPSLMWINVALLVFNLLPAFPMDGGRVLRALLALKLDYPRATQIAASVGQGMAIVFGFFGLIQFNPFLLFIALFVYLGAQQESSATQLRVATRGVHVRQAMVTDYHDLHPWQTLQDAVDLLLAVSEQDFPVIQDGQMVGVLTRKRLVQALSEQTMQTRVQQVMLPAPAPVNAGNMLDQALERLQADDVSMLPVVDQEGALVGLLTLENVGEMMMLASAMRRRTGMAPSLDSLAEGRS
ncbi:MAG: site-2 protease family protein [Bacteroidota bacterium]